MPAIVDHDQRRLDIAAAVEAIVARSGVQAVTIREVGRETGCSPTVVTHYFSNKLELMTFTYVNARLRSIRRVESALAAGKNYLECLAECLPTSKARMNEWKIWFGYWGMIEQNPILLGEQRKGVEDSFDLFCRVLDAARSRGDVPADCDIEYHAERSMYLLNGIASLSLQTPEQWPAKKQRLTLEREMAALSAG